MPKRREQSHHGDEVMSSLTYEDENHKSGQERQKNPNDKHHFIGLLSKTSIYRSLVACLLNYFCLFTSCQLWSHLPVLLSLLCCLYWSSFCYQLTWNAEVNTRRFFPQVVQRVIYCVRSWLFSIPPGWHRSWTDSVPCRSWPPHCPADSLPWWCS